VFKPDSLKDNAPVVINFHGSMGSGKNMRDLSGYDFDYLAVAHGFLVVYPDGYENHWNDCRSSASYAANVENIDDVSFVKAMVKDLQVDYGIDTSRVIVTGFSNGGHMVYRLAMETPESIFIAAPIAANMPVDANLDCTKSGKPVHMSIFNGTKDTINPYLGGLVEVLGNASRGEVLSSDETLNYWAGLAEASQENQITNHFTETDGNPDTKVTRFLRTGQKHVALYRLEGSGHVVPSPFMYFGDILGQGAQDINAAEEIFRFYEMLDAN
jgi:polyhydroxybutyrate depolymerase